MSYNKKESDDVDLAEFTVCIVIMGWCLSVPACIINLRPVVMRTGTGVIPTLECGKLSSQ